MARYSNFTGVRYDNFRSFLIALALYFSLLAIFLYQISEYKNKAKKYTDDLGAIMDIAIPIDFDDSPIPTAPNIAEEDKEGDQHEQEEKPVEEETLKTTTEVTTPPPPPASKPEPAKEEVKKEEPKPEPEPEPIPEKKPEEPKPKEEAKKEPEPNLNDLFSDTTKDNKKLSESVSKNDAVQSSKKSDKQTQTKAKKQATSRNALVKSNVVTGKTQLTGEYDAYRGKINKILQRLWSKYATTVNDDSTVVVTFGGDGRISDYQIKRLGANTEFNQKLRDFLGNLEMQNFPKSPDGKPFIYEINLNDVVRNKF
ncbi:TonB C-terminal domain-containing protein [Campylobacter sp. JMF_02 ED1]|uniref:TonB C-terminal domain-containing protein n=1 Tax=unclassified Campylobacter TaxID=2593542 RepID=UPI0022E9B2A6|nr:MULTISPECIES: TonB C-terminal domain-containing protein [unclassified Campylobacter]MDA3049668.1 TonB C-terminal domain-containing protein [Campylobacter sp. JMF_15 NE4]MDA3050626.1 TonB C-terminal domain-containing protein [Campylobacter sp. JMF_02 ED1]